MPEEKWLTKYIDGMNARIDEVEDKLDDIRRLIWMVSGGAIVLSSAGALIINILLAKLH